MAQDESAKRRYRDAYERWQRDLQRLHRALLAGEALDPPHRVALLRNESHTHDRYEEARRHLLGLDDEAVVPEATNGDEEDA